MLVESIFCLIHHFFSHDSDNLHAALTVSLNAEIYFAAHKHSKYTHSFKHVL